LQVLTYEVSAMDLKGTELVVLSACETGLGEVAEGEGVYGLRRAFQMAGARTVVSALWPVSDQATAEMMSSLYARDDESLPDAMRRVQLEKISELRSEGSVDHPFTWGAFIALGDWR
jgi:CHAT domain-containing protein